MNANEKDAMALAVIERLVRAAHLAYAMPPTDDEVTALREHIAHLASRIAELEGELEVQREQNRLGAARELEFLDRATRAEAELAAVREDAKDAQHVIWLLLRSNGGALTISAQAARELDPGQAAIEQTIAPSGEVSLRAIDAARGGE